MRSTEQSGVGAERFTASRAPDEQSGLDAALDWIAQQARSVSPITLAVTVTAFIAAGLFVTTDAIRTLVLEPPVVATATELTEPAQVPSLGTAVEGVLARGAGAFGLALLAACFAYRRRPEEPDVPQTDITSLIATMPFGVACWSAEGLLIARNDRFANRVGKEEMLVPGARYAEVLRTMLRGGRMQSMRDDKQDRLLELHREDGSTLLIEERPLADGGGFVTMVMDVTESRRTTLLLESIREDQRHLARRYHEEKIRAEAASRSKTSFLAHLSHDIRTPLNHIIGFADMLHNQPFGPLGDERYLNYVAAVKGSGERLLGFFATILELAELEGGRRDLRREKFTADDLLLTVLRRFSSQAQRAGLTLGLGGACEALINADRFAAERMVGNLIDNALRFTPRGGRVTLAAYAALDGIVLEITDTGIGMPAERLEALSQPFVFGDAALTKDREGSGLGIAISRAIAEASGGHLAIDSRQGLGTTVAISLPIALSDAAEGPKIKAA